MIWIQDSATQKRYSFTGNIQADYSYKKNGVSTDPDFATSINWNLTIIHNQSIDPTMHLDVNLQYSSSNYARQNVTNFNELLQNNIYSNATLFKTWEEAGKQFVIKL